MGVPCSDWVGSEVRGNFPIGARSAQGVCSGVMGGAMAHTCCSVPSRIMRSIAWSAGSSGEGTWTARGHLGLGSVQGSARVGQGRLVLPSAARAALSSITRLAWTMDSYLYFNRRIPLCGQTFACCIDQRHATQALP